MSQHKSVFLSDVPVTTVDGNLLWAEDTLVLQEVREITDAILAEAGGLTLAVYGAWGAGKTSFLRMVEDTVRSNRGDQRIVFCWYNASTYRGIGVPATTLLALRIWSALRGDEELPPYATPGDEPSDPFERYMQTFFADVEWEERGHKRYEFLQQLAQQTGQLVDFPRFLGNVLLSGGPLSTGSRKLVLVVDDLDRCRSDFIGDILDALQRLSSVQNLFTLIGVDREVLLTAVKKRYEGLIDLKTILDEHLALEKYVQYAVNLPDMTPELLTGYVQRCLEQEESDDEDENRVLEAISESAAYFAVGVRVKTPRAIKRCINAILPVLRMRLAQEPDLPDDERRLVIKEQLLAYNWRAFYHRYFQPARRDPGSAEYRIFYNLEILCSRHYSKEAAEESPELQRDRRAIFELQLDRIKKREFSNGSTLEVPNELATLLAQPPFWFFGREKEKPSERMLDIADMEVFGIPGLDEEFTKLYIQSEQADAVGNGRASVQAAAKAYELVRRNRQSFGKSVAPQLGNLGVNAEKYKALDLAEQIWRLALEIDPEHSSIMQQFASYIIDNRPDLYSEAEEILSKLRTGRHAEHKPWRTLSLLVQLKAALGQEVDGALTAQMAKAAETETDVRQLGAILDGLIDAGGQFQLGLQLFASTVERFPRKSRYTLQRMVADALAHRSEIECEFIAMDLYRQILANPEIIDAGDEPSVMTNYATLLYKHDYDDEAGCLWFKAYQFPTGSGHSGIRRAYSMYLLRADRGDMAQKVIGGEPIDEMVLIPTEKKLPERFSDVELPDALSESGKSPFFRCVEQSDSGI